MRDRAEGNGTRREMKEEKKRRSKSKEEKPEKEMS
jgi:hypothetical protein